MNKTKVAILTFSHLSIGIMGFVIGIYLLPILIAPESPTLEMVNQRSEKASYSAVFNRDLTDSDAFHWGEGKVFIGQDSISFIGELAPGPDYRVYLAKEFVQTEEKFNQLKPSMEMVGHVNTFENFIVSIPEGIDPNNYNTVIVWCERFGEFITSAKYQ